MDYKWLFLTLMWEGTVALEHREHLQYVMWSSVLKPDDAAGFTVPEQMIARMNL